MAYLQEPLHEISWQFGRRRIRVPEILEDMW